jgi:hypothetical protein
MAWVARIGADAQDDVSLGSLVIFARTRRLKPLLVAQLLDILLMTTLGQMFSGGFLPSGGVALWGILAPLGALVFIEVRPAVRWFATFIVVFLVTGLAGEFLFSDECAAWSPRPGRSPALRLRSTHSSRP